MALVNVPKSIAFFETTLAAAISSTATSFTLTAAVDADGTTLADDTYAFVIDEGSSNEEIVVCRCIATAATEALRGVSVRTGNTEITALKKSHRRGASVKMTTGPIVPIVTNIMRGEDELDFTPTLPGSIVTKQYADDIASAGAADANTTTKGLVEQATQAEHDAKTEEGSTTAKLVVSPNNLRSTKYNDYVADTGSANAYEIAPAPAITAYAVGQEFTFKATNANTGASTIDISGLGTKDIKKAVGGALMAGDIVADQIVKVMYDGTNMEVVTPIISQRVGDGSDGSVTISGTTTLTSDMQYENLTVTGTLITDGYFVRVRGVLGGTGTIKHSEPDNGTDGSVVSAGSSYTGGAGGGAGNSGGGVVIFATNVEGSFTIESLGGDGGDGGNSTGSGGGNPLGGAGTLARGSGSLTGGAGGAGGQGGYNEQVGSTGVAGENADNLSLQSAGVSGGRGGDGGTGYTATGAAGTATAPTVSPVTSKFLLEIFRGIDSSDAFKTCYEVASGSGGSGGGADDSDTDAGGGGAGAGGNGGFGIMASYTSSWTGSSDFSGGTGGTGGLKTSSSYNGEDGGNGADGTLTEISLNELL